VTPDTPRPYHGVTIRDSCMIIGSLGGTITPEAIRQWIHRGHLIRTRDGHIDPCALVARWEELHPSVGS
jgi:hypothetical protein